MQATMTIAFSKSLTPSELGKLSQTLCGKKDIKAISSLSREDYFLISSIGIQN